MSRVICLALCIVLILSLSAACSSDIDISDVTVRTPVYPDSISFDDYDSQWAVRDNNPIDDRYIGALNEFSYKTASKILTGQSNNLSYSPVSLYMALSLAGTGADGQTQDEIFSILGVDGMGADFLSKQNSNFFRLLYLDNEIAKLKIANSLWLQKGIDFKNDFIDNAAQNFYASLYNVDFKDKNTARCC
jgi:serine protease inhibitor